MEDDDPLAKAYGALSDELLQWAMGKEKQSLSHGNTTARTIEELRRDVDEAEDRNDLARLESTLIELAATLGDAGELTSAAEMFQKAAGIQPGRGQRVDYAITLALLGQVLQLQGRFDEAIAELQRALVTFRALGFRSGESLVLAAMATTFRKDIRKDPDKADNLYQSSIEAAPKNADNLGSYASFLAAIRKDFDKAEELYKRAIEADPKHAYNLGNYAGMLLALGRQTDGLSLLDRALDVPNSTLEQRTECWFYALAHRASEQRGEALSQVKRLIVSEGARSPGWDLSSNIERARSDGHPDVAWLALLANVINEKAEPAVLEAWRAWMTA